MPKDLFIDNSPWITLHLLEFYSHIQYLSVDNYTEKTANIDMQPLWIDYGPTLGSEAVILRIETLLLPGNWPISQIIKRDLLPKPGKTLVLITFKLFKMISIQKYEPGYIIFNGWRVYDFMEFNRSEVASETYMPDIS